MWRRFLRWADALRRDAMTVWFCGRHPRTPWSIRLLALALAAYALSPIDLVPDFIPVLGYIDEVILLPAGIWLCLRLMPSDVLAECRQQSAKWFDERKVKPRSVTGAVIIVVLWMAMLWAAWIWWMGR